MVEKKLIIDELELNYTGLFDLNGLMKAIDTVAAAKGYGKNEKRRSEKVTTTGREFYIELRPAKKKTDFFILMIKIRMSINNMRDVEVLQDGRKIVLNEGEIKMLFDAWTSTDYEFRWESNPIYYILRNIFERVAYKVHTDKYNDEVADDCHYMHKNIKAYLNMHRF